MPTFVLSINGPKHDEMQNIGKDLSENEKKEEN